MRHGQKRLTRIRFWLSKGTVIIMFYVISSNINIIPPLIVKFISQSSLVTLSLHLVLLALFNSYLSHTIFLHFLCTLLIYLAILSCSGLYIPKFFLIKANIHKRILHLNWIMKITNRAVRGRLNIKADLI